MEVPDEDPHPQEAEILHSVGADVILNLSDDGFGFVTVSDRRVWCCDVFELRLVADEGQHFVLQPGGVEAIELRAWLSEVKRMSLDAKDEDNTVGLGVWLFAKPWWGARAWWSIPSLWEWARPFGRTTCSERQQSWWSWWRKALDEISLSIPHLRRACPYNGRLGRDREAANYFGVEHRLLEYSTLSSHACVANLARLAGPRKVANGNSKMITKNLARLLDRICSELVAPSCLAKLTICLDGHVAAAPLPATTGRSMVELDCEHGRVDLNKQVRPATSCSAAWAARSSWPSRSCSYSCTSWGKSGKEVFKQVVCFCGCALDEFVVASASGSAPMEVDGGAGNGACAGDETNDRDASGRVSRMVRMAAAVQAGGRRMLRYFFCAGEVFKSPQFLGLSVDASRAARKNVLLGV